MPLEHPYKPPPRDGLAEKISASIPYEVWCIVHEMAETKGMKLSHVVRDALILWINKES